MAKEDEAGGEQAGAAAEAQPRSRRKLILLGAVALLVLLGAGGGAYFFFGRKGEPVAEEAKPQEVKASVYYNLPGFLVNMNSRGPKASFLKITVSLELNDLADVQRIQAVMPRVIDHMQAYMRELRTEDVKGAAALARVRAELVDRVNLAAQPTQVKDVLFLEVLVQ